MLNVVVVSIRFILLVLCGQKQIALENVACVSKWPCSTQLSAAKAEQPRSIVLDQPLYDLAGLEISVDDRAAGNRNLLASQAVQTVLVEVIPI